MNSPTAADAASLESRVLALLLEIAPDIDPASVRPDRDFRDQFDFDSMDLFNFAISIHQSFGIDIPEREYRNLTSLRKCAAYLQRTLPKPQAGASKPEAGA